MRAIPLIIATLFIWLSLILVVDEPRHNRTLKILRAWDRTFQDPTSPAGDEPIEVTVPLLVMILLAFCLLYMVYSSHIGPYRVKFGPCVTSERFLCPVSDMSTPLGPGPSGESSRTFRVLSFNVLAQSLARSEMHSHISKGVLRKDKRLPLVAQEVLRYDADIILLQEVPRVMNYL